MRLGFFTSLLLHAALLVWALVSIAQTREFKVPDPEPIASDVITESELAQLRKGSRTAKLDDAVAKDVLKPDEAIKDTPKPKPVNTPPPPPPPPVEAEVKPPEPEKPAEPPPPAAKSEPDKAALDKVLDEVALQKVIEDEKKKADAAAKAKSEADAKAKAVADAKAKALAKAKADAKAKAKAIADAKARSERIAALIDKAPDPKQAAAAAPASATPTKAVGPVKGARDGADAANQGNALLGKIIEKVKTCWNIQAGGSEASAQAPKIRFELNRDGSLRGDPKVVNNQGSPQFQLAADAAKRALIECQNYDLPADKYEVWKIVTLDFDPREMFQ